MASKPVNEEVNLDDLDRKDASTSTFKGSAQHDDTLVEMHEPYVKPGNEQPTWHDSHLG